MTLPREYSHETAGSFSIGIHNRQRSGAAGPGIKHRHRGGPGAPSYHIYRATTAGGEGSTPIATTTSTTFKDAHLSTTPVYFYQITAVNSAGESGRTPEDASKTPPPVGTGGNAAGIPSGNST